MAEFLGTVTGIAILLALGFIVMFPIAFSFNLLASTITSKHGECQSLMRQ